MNILIYFHQYTLLKVVDTYAVLKHRFERQVFADRGAFFLNHSSVLQYRYDLSTKADVIVTYSMITIRMLWLLCKSITRWILSLGRNNMTNGESIWFARSCLTGEIQFEEARGLDAPWKTSPTPGSRALSCQLHCEKYRRQKIWLHFWLVLYLILICILYCCFHFFYFLLMDHPNKNGKLAFTLRNHIALLCTRFYITEYIYTLLLYISGFTGNIIPLFFYILMTVHW